jgi:hypothetical protein
MLRKVFFKMLFVIAFVSPACRKQVSIEGLWKPYKVKMWDNYFADFLLIDLDAQSLRFSDSATHVEVNSSPNYVDSILGNMSNAYLLLDRQHNFEMNDYAFFTQMISDSAWQGRKNGVWTDTESLLSLNQGDSLIKCFKIMSRSEKNLTIGELYRCNGRPITEIFLRR